jgi:hypothetical protein
VNSSGIARGVVFALLAFVVPFTAQAQHEHHQTAPDSGWGWSFDSNVFVTANFQERKFRDFHQVESQNWFMAMGSRRAGDGTLTLHGMLSMEPFTLRDLGSSEVFQTGETFGGAPLIDYQHPHDLFMGLSAAYVRPIGRASLLIRGGLVDEPALGPTAYMHRESANLQPAAPLSHHELDSTHITPGVITGGVRAGAWLVESSAFYGREPDENRTDIDLGPLDSYSVRGTWIRGETRAQVSIGHINEPDINEPGDVIRLTASFERNGTLAGRRSAMTVAFGQNNELFDTENAILTEMTLGLWRRGTTYVRAEIADKHILGAGGRHPIGQQHPHIISPVGALTLGYSHDVLRVGAQTLAVGADVTGYRTPTELVDSYGRPVSFHVYGRWNVARK